MENSTSHKGLKGIAIYSIEIEGHLPVDWSDWFEGFALTSTRNALGNPVTILTGRVADQSMLHGILARIRDLGLPLVSLSRTTDENPELDKRGKK